MPIITRRGTPYGQPGGDPFKKLQVDNHLILTNGHSFGLDRAIPAESYIEFEVDAANGNGNTYTGINPSRAVIMRYLANNKGETDDYGNNTSFFVKAFPTIVRGSIFGRFESVNSSDFSANPVVVPGIPADMRRSNHFPGSTNGVFSLTNPNYLNDSRVWDLNVSRNLVGLPERVGDFPNLTYHYDIDTSGRGTDNGFIDIYGHDVDTAKRLPGGWPGSIQHNTFVQNGYGPLLGTINGINANHTKDWNINIWYRSPYESNGGSLDSDGDWSGGDYAGTYTVDGSEWDLYYKIETASSNNFDFLGFVSKEGRVRGTLNIHNFIFWVRDNLPGLLTPGSPTFNQAAYDKYNASRPVGKTAPRFFDNDHVVCGVHWGNEIWWSNPDNSEATVTYNRFEIEMDGFPSFGWNNGQQATIYDQLAPPYTTANNDPQYTTAGTPLPKAPSLTSTTVGSDRVISLQSINETSPPVSFTETDPTKSQIIALDPLTIRGLAVGVNTYVFTAANGDRYTIDFTVSAASGGGQTLAFNGFVAVNGTIDITPAQLHTSGSLVDEITAEPGFEYAGVLLTQPVLRIFGKALGVAQISYRLVNGATGTIQIEVTADTTGPDPGANPNPTPVPVIPYLSTRYLKAGEELDLDMRHMPALEAFQNRQVGATTGQAQATITSARFLKITAPVTSTGSGEVEVTD